MREIRDKLTHEMVMLNKLAMTVREAGEAAHKAGDTALQHKLERIDWLVQRATAPVFEAFEITYEGESK